MLKPIEELNAGDEILTRDAGVQEIRWIGQVTMRASGAFAPVLMKAGALSNVNDLVLGPEHRLFIYQRSDELGTGRSETLVRVRHLVNGNDVRRIEAGYIDYYQILFDEHQFIYAEGIPVESQLL
ncbi:MAG: Hint domain-containing protein, partial [Paracoccaceae bacterium]